MFDPATVLAQLTLAEKTSLLCGADMWHTVAVPRLGVPSIRMSDGPNAIRGTRTLDPIPTNVFPCPSSLACSFNPELLREVGAALGQEAKAKGASCILGPMANLTRSPLAGRGYENFGEDPLLTGIMAGEIIKGIQNTKVVATLKHFVCNDVEEDRKSADSVVAMRTLREIYLRPFEIATKIGKPLAYMAGYNRLNGVHVSEDKWLFDVLKNEWDFDGLIMSDWYGTYTTAEALEAGLDLEMPGPSKLRGPLIEVAMTSGKLSQATVDARVLKILEFVSNSSQVDISAEETTIDTPSTRELLRRAARESIVMLKNDSAILPLKSEKIAMIGHHAILPYYAGGEPALPRPVRYVTPLQGVQEHAEPQFCFGAYSHKLLPMLALEHAGRPGYQLSFYNDESRSSPAKQMHLTDTIAFLSWTALEGVVSKPWATLEGSFSPSDSGIWDFGLVMIGRGKLFINDMLVVDNWSNQTKGEEFFGYGTIEQFGEIELQAGQTYAVKLVMDSESKFQVPGSGFRLGGAKRIDVAAERERACELAEQSDVAIVCVGLSHEWESEGFDRKDMKLPQDLDDLVSAVAERQPNTVVVVQCGTPVEMPWADKVKGILMLGYPGNEGGHALADILYGVSPTAKMSVTLPKRLQDNPSFLNFPGEDGKVNYGEGVYMGYRYYDTAGVAPLFPFGHGLTYTTFTMSDLAIENSNYSVSLTLTLANTGSVAAAEIVQVYVHTIASAIRRPLKELRAFERVWLEPGQTKTVMLQLDREAFAVWKNGWWVQKGEYEVLVGASVDDIRLKGKVQLDERRY